MFDAAHACAAAAAIAFGTAALLVVALHVAPSGVSILGDGVSGYALERHAAWYRAQVVLFGSGGLLLAAAIGLRASEAGGLAALVAFALARVAIARFPTDARGAAVTRTGGLHILLALVAFVCLPVVALRLSPAVGQLVGEGQPYGGWLTALSWALTVAMVVMFGSSVGATRRFFGLFERSEYLTGFAWLLLAAAVLAVA